MEKIWYILINGKEEGPYSSMDLLDDHRVTLNTLVWKEGFKNWIPLRRVEELRKLFEQRRPETDEDAEEEGFRVPPQEEIALEYSMDPNFFFLLILLALLLLGYIFYRFL